MRARLFLDIDFDETRGDAESIAAALDSVITTGLDLLGNLDEYGKVTVSDTGVIPPIVVETEGGLITAIGARGGLPAPVITIDYDAPGGVYGAHDLLDTVPQGDDLTRPAGVGVYDIDDGDPLLRPIADFADETLADARSAEGTVRT